MYLLLLCAFLSSGERLNITILYIIQRSTKEKFNSMTFILHRLGIL
jgi:hypothetical protein